ncbi:MAG: NAD(P)H-hydrate dehydratase [bacterium]|nr:NAD(P)H-hydrate dehydratase [bacterium]
MTLVTAAEMRALDRFAIEHGTPGRVLMERAGAGAARALRARFGRVRGPVVIVCGKGNNGGDGFVVARHLKAAKRPVDVWLAGRREDLRGDAAWAAGRWRGPVQHLAGDGDVARLAVRLARAGVVVDALLGTGLDKPVTGTFARVIEAINASGRPVLAIDLPSGMHADTGAPLGVAVQATATVTFAFAKIGQVTYPGLARCGPLDVVDIGIPDAALAAVAPRARLLDDAGVGALLAPRRPDSHKGTYGHVLVVAGSRGKGGAAVLCSHAAGRTGAGLTTLALPAALQPQLEARVPEIMTADLPDGPDGTASAGDGGAIDRLLAGRAAVVCGPGLGQNPGVKALVARVLQGTTAPLVLDADGLNAVDAALLRRRSAPTIVTPHPGEMSRLVGLPTAEVQADRPGVARRFAADTGVVVVLKGARTLIAAPDGTLAVCPTGNPGMATGGMGDVLAGVTGGLLAQGLAPLDAACLAVYLHGAAADAVAARRGQVGLLAGDLLDELPPTLARLQQAARHD